MGTEASQAHLAYHRRAQKRRGRKHHRKGPRPLPVASAPPQPEPEEQKPPEPLEPQVGTMGKVLLDDEKHARRTLIDIKRIMELGGTFSADEATGLLRAAGVISSKAVEGAKSGTMDLDMASRIYNRCMAVMFTAGKMQMELDRRSDPQQQGQGVTVNVATVGGEQQAIGVQVYVPDNGRNRPYEDEDDLDE